MSDRLTLVRDNVGPSLLRYAEVMQRTLADTVRRAAKGITRRVINLTPPASGEGMTGAAAYRQGRVKIAKQMGALLAPVKLKGRREIKVVFGHRLARPVFVHTKERYPDVAGLYRANLRTLPNGVGMRLKDYRGKKFYVDVRKFNAVLKARQARVGALASGWSIAAAALDVPVQQWISRHGRSGGAIKLELSSPKMRIIVRNFAPGLPANLRAEMERRIPYAVQYQLAAMKREVEYMAFKNAEKLAIKTRSWSHLVPEGMMGG